MSFFYKWESALINNINSLSHEYCKCDALFCHKEVLNLYVVELHDLFFYKVLISAFGIMPRKKVFHF